MSCFQRGYKGLRQQDEEPVLKILKFFYEGSWSKNVKRKTFKVQKQGKTSEWTSKQDKKNDFKRK